MSRFNIFHKNKQNDDLQHRMESEYADPFSYSIPASTFKRNHLGSLMNALTALPDDKLHNQFKSLAKVAMKELNKCIHDPKASDNNKKIANEAADCLVGIASSLYIQPITKTDSSKLSDAATKIYGLTDNLRKSARACRLLAGKGRKIAGILMTIAGVATVIASSALALFSFGGALPISAPLAGAGVALSAAGMVTTFGPWRTKRHLNQAAKIADTIANSFTKQK